MQFVESSNPKEQSLVAENKKCSYCQMDIPFKATKCPYCQSELQNHKKNSVAGVFLGLLIAVVFIPLVAFLLFAGEPPETRDDSTLLQETAESPKLNGLISRGSSSGIDIRNEDDFAWIDCLISLNTSYRANTASISPGTHYIPYGNFIKRDGARFNYYTTEVMYVEIECKDPKAVIHATW